MSDYVIWSIEHQAWWKPGRCGYSTDLHDAGRYDEREARRILKDANIVRVNETMIPVVALGEFAAPPNPWRVGDLVRVARGSGVNRPGARGVVVERYHLEGRWGVMLLFEDGRSDGFSPEDCAHMGVERIGYCRALGHYQFTSVVALDRDWQTGVFVAAWTEVA